MALPEEDRAQSRRAASSRYNSRNREVRNEKTKARMAKLRAAEGTLPAEEQAARKEARSRVRAVIEKARGMFIWSTVQKQSSSSGRGGMVQRQSSSGEERCPKEGGWNKKKGYWSGCDSDVTAVTHSNSTSMSSSTNESYYPPAPISADVKPPHDFRPCAIPDHLGGNFSDHIDFTRLGNKRYWVLFWPKMPAGMYSLKADVLAAAMEAGTAAASPAVLQSYNGWRDVWVAWAQHCWVRHARCDDHPNACCDGQCPAHPPPLNPEVIKVSKRRVKREDGSEPAPRIKSEAPSASVQPKRKARRSWSTDDEAESYTAPLYDPDTPPEGRQQRRRGGTKALDDPVSPSPAAAAVVPEGGIRAQPLRRIQDIHTARSSSASAVPSSATPSSVSSLSASTATAAADAGGNAAWMGGLDNEALRVALREDPFFVGLGGTIWHSRREAFEAVSEGPVQAVVGWDAATELAVELNVHGISAEELGGRGVAKQRKFACIASILPYLLHEGETASTLATPRRRGTCTHKACLRTKGRTPGRETGAPKDGTKRGGHKVVAGLQAKLKGEEKKRRADKKLLVKRLKALRAEQREAESGLVERNADSGDETDDMEEELELRERLGKNWRSGL
ncbi:hypothetical protein C8F04DRAFT_1192287 [Mycena alexandri]|uniref:Uncharacterized protein n=1 Tax=Mycena alexandri TaxID=1745969 RepID=A0AAD6WTQ9_9AGAR|nr:hypothetical protein C8F04DRAFT_1192287 [Mycena alexandri]